MARRSLLVRGGSIPASAEEAAFPLAQPLLSRALSFVAQAVTGKPEVLGKAAWEVLCRADKALLIGLYVVTIEKALRRLWRMTTLERRGLRTCDYPDLAPAPKDFESSVLGAVLPLARLLGLGWWAVPRRLGEFVIPPLSGWRVGTRKSASLFSERLRWWQGSGGGIGNGGGIDNGGGIRSG